MLPELGDAGPPVPLDGETRRALVLAGGLQVLETATRDGGVLVAWKGRRDADEEAELARAAEATAMAADGVLDVGAEAGYEHRHLHVVRKTGATPTNLPRRAGIAKKRPYGARK